MGNFFNYIRDYGNLTISEKPITEVDMIIFSQICYIDFSKASPDLATQSETISSIAEKLNNINYSNILGVLVPDTILPLFYTMAKLPRYKDLTLERYEKVLDTNAIEQFCAITINLGNNVRCVSFCGTDDTIIGWEENINMMYMKAIPAQIRSKEYLDSTAREYKSKIYVTGHSKGGNLSFYSALHATKYTKQKLLKVYSFDGPGLSDKDSKNLQKSFIYDKFVSYITECSIVGKLFNNPAKTIICKSTNRGLMQHDSFSWVIEEDGFARSKEQAKESVNIDITIKSILDSMDERQRKELVSTIFRIISFTDAENLTDIKLQQIVSIIKGYFSMEHEDKKLFRTITKKLLKDRYLRKIFLQCIIDFSKKKPFNSEEIAFIDDKKESNN